MCGKRAVQLIGAVVIARVILRWRPSCGWA